METDKQKISHFQLGVLFFVYMTGSSIINIPGPLIGKAGNGAWISLLVSGALGYMMLMMLLFLHNRFPGLNYVEYSRKLVGNVMTVVIGLLAISFILQEQSGIVMDVGLFMVSSMLRETPIYVFTILVFLVAALTARAGLEVMARMFTLIMLLTSFFIIVILLLAIPDYNPLQLLPVLPKGLKPVLHGAYFTFGFPYSEVFLFGMLIPFVERSQRKRVPKALMLSLGLNIFTLCMATICSIMVFGAYAGDRPYVLFNMARLVEFQEVIQRIESIIGMSLILGSYMKVTVTLYVLSLFVSGLFGLKESSAIVMPLALAGFLMGLVTFDGATQWGSFIMSIHPLWTGAAYLLPLLLLTIVAAFRKPESSA
ncbi:GerAB/ArcD/ProY family transporter [Paenibacillus sp. 2TAB19]|uniref:GerAB/ArcD/ProY family transporter n=1 Tax=Paenibacillus sp. 2TAB19 TaxID=3233003 RepID=UPI003F9B8C95